MVVHGEYGYGFAFLRPVLIPLGKRIFAAIKKIQLHQPPRLQALQGGYFFILILMPAGFSIVPDCNFRIGLGEGPAVVL